MKNSPRLAATIIPADHRDGYKVARTFRVEGGLHYIKGNSSPYFSLTYTAHRVGFPNQCWSGGAGHDEILKRFPQFADLAALHLCDIDGAPMYDADNGWYYLAAALGGMGERFHAGNSPRNFPVMPPIDKPWQNTESRNPTQAESIATFAHHMRLTDEEARDFIASLAIPRDNVSAAYAPAAKAALAILVETMRPRWKAEAEACIKNHGLQIYGDEYKAA